jgi:hypothetical protein
MLHRPRLQETVLQHAPVLQHKLQGTQRKNSNSQLCRYTSVNQLEAAVGGGVSSAGSHCLLLYAAAAAPCRSCRPRLQQQEAWQRATPHSARCYQACMALACACGCSHSCRPGRQQMKVQGHNSRGRHVKFTELVAAQAATCC